MIAIGKQSLGWDSSMSCACSPCRSASPMPPPEVAHQVPLQGRLLSSRRISEDRGNQALGQCIEVGLIALGEQCRRHLCNALVHPIKIAQLLKRVAVGGPNGAECSPNCVPLVGETIWRRPNGKDDF